MCAFHPLSDSFFVFFLYLSVVCLHIRSCFALYTVHAVRVRTRRLTQFYIIYILCYHRRRTAADSIFCRSYNQRQTWNGRLQDPLYSGIMIN